MVCNKCGATLEKGSDFCIKCGNKIGSISNENGSITFVRRKKLYGKLVPIKIYIDGQEAAHVKDGGEVTIPVKIGKHRIAFNLWSGNGQYDIEVAKDKPNIKVNFEIKFGIIQSKPKITDIVPLQS